MEQAQAVSAALEQLHQASQAMGVQGIHGMGMPLPPGHTQHEQAMQLPLQHQVGCSGLASGELQGCGYRMSRCPHLHQICAAAPDEFDLRGCPKVFALGELM